MASVRITVIHLPDMGGVKVWVARDDVFFPTEWGAVQNPRTLKIHRVVKGDPIHFLSWFPWVSKNSWAKLFCFGVKARVVWYQKLRKMKTTTWGTPQTGAGFRPSFPHWKGRVVRWAHKLNSWDGVGHCKPIAKWNFQKFLKQLFSHLGFGFSQQWGEMFYHVLSSWWWLASILQNGPLLSPILYSF